MLLIGLTSLLMAIGLGSSSSFPASYQAQLGNMGTTMTPSNTLYSSTITPTLLTRMTSITLLFSAALSFNALYVQAIGSGLGLYSGLFHITSVTQALEAFLFIVGAIILLPWASEKPDMESDKKVPVQGDFQAPWSAELISGNDLRSAISAVPSIAEYPLIILFTTIGASFLISSSDLVSMYLSIELQSFAVYILAAIYRNSESATSAGLKYFLLGALSSALILLGSSLIYAYTGLTSFEGIYMIANTTSDMLIMLQAADQGVVTVGVTSQENISQGIVLGVLIIGVGFLFKVAAAPFHNWAPDVYDGVPTIVTTWLTVMPKISIFVFLLELQIGSETNLPLESISVLFGDGTMNVWKNLLLTTSLLSLIIGTVVGLAQYRLKRLLAFSTISHVGFLLLALSVNSEESITSFLFYLMQYSITNLDAFFVVLAFGYVIHSSTSSQAELGNASTNNSDLSFIAQLKGQFHANPVLGLSLAICLFSMAGIPPLVGFFAKYLVLYSAIENGYYFLALVGILASVVSAAYYLRIIRVIHFDSSSASAQLFSSKFPSKAWEHGEEQEHGKPAGKDPVVLTSTHSYVIAVLTLFITLFILSPSLFLNSSNLLALSLFTA